MSDYKAKVIEKIDNGKGYWNSLKLGVFDGDTQLGEYVRNYHGFGESTFFPFEQDGLWYALYSKDYTAMRVMTLPDCKDLCGEEPNSDGFCPVEFYVPKITVEDFKKDEVDPRPYNPRHDPERWAEKKKESGYTTYVWPDDKDRKERDKDTYNEFQSAKEKCDKELKEYRDRHPFVTKFARFGFMSGCYFGDDSSWKVRFIDLSRVSEGIVTQDERFGYIWLPAGVYLKDAIDVQVEKEYDSPEKQFVDIALPVRFDLTGKRHNDD